jgi:protein-S-isoprenylcysteine O-methyltransferase Ste14
MKNWSRLARRVRVPLSFVLAALYLWLAHPVWHSLIGGGVLAFGGLAWRAAASGYVHKDRELTTAGPYAYMRNPLYFGSLIIGAGFAVAARSLAIAAGMAALFLLVYLPVIQAEERFLRSKFPAYDDYARRVPRFGFKLAGRTKTSAVFSARRYLHHREYNAFIGAVAMLAALAAKLWWRLR